MKVVMERWHIKVTDGVIGMVHGQSFDIMELYIPRYQIAFNIDGRKKVNIFKTDRTRYKITEGKLASTYKIEKEFADFLKKYLKNKDILSKRCFEVIKNLPC